MPQTGSPQNVVKATQKATQKLYDEMGGFRINDHPLLDALDWLLHEVAIITPVLRSRRVADNGNGDMDSDKQWDEIKSQHLESLKPILARINAVVENAALIAPLSKPILDTAKRYAREVVNNGSIRHKDLRHKETCPLCNQPAPLNDKVRHAGPDTRYIPVHILCHKELKNRLSKVLGLSRTANTRVVTSVPFAQANTARPQRPSVFRQLT